MSKEMDGCKAKKRTDDDDLQQFHTVMSSSLLLFISSLPPLTTNSAINIEKKITVVYTHIFYDIGL